MDEKEELKLKRLLKSRYVATIAVGGAIDTGLFLGSGTAVRSAGPSTILSYLIVGAISSFIMKALGELILVEPDQHSLIESVEKYLGSRVELAVGRTYWLC